MSTQRYSVTPHPVETLLTWVKSGEIAIPEIQRPFVWAATKVRDLLDSLYRGYPVGYLIAWRNRNKRPELRGRGFGLSDGKVADPEDFFHSFMLNALAYAGIARSAEMLAEVDPASARRLAAEARLNAEQLAMATLSKAPLA